MDRLLLIADDYVGWQPPKQLPGGIQVRSSPPGVRVPTAAEIAQADITIVFAVQNQDAATQLAGAIAQALHDAKSVVIVAYPVGLNDGRAQLLDRLGLPVEYQGSPNPVTTQAAAFASYFRRFGIAKSGWFDLPENAVALGQCRTTTDRGAAIAALSAPIGKGTLYVLPFHVANFIASHDELVDALRDAVHEHEASESDALPDYLAELRLPGEQELLDDITYRSTELAAKRSQAARLERFRLLLGLHQGDALEALVIETMNVVFEGSALRAQDQDELFKEDFWIVDDTDKLALAEVKGVNSGVKRSHINQVDNHREELGLDTLRMPGLLIMNIHRTDTNLKRKLSEPLHPSIIAQLRRQNVLFLRTADLYALVHRSLAGTPAHSLMTDALRQGGGWLEVTVEHTHLHNGDS
jgi:hypothetical protein